MIQLEQHQSEIHQNLQAWEKKPLLQQIYADFYRRILALIDRNIPGLIVEVGSGIGNLKSQLPAALATDLFPNPWLDVVCDGYEMPFRPRSVSHLVLFDVFHHLRAPKAFLEEAARVLTDAGRIILFEPYISFFSHPVYGCLHHEPVGWNAPISEADRLPRPRDYYAAQGNATRLFFPEKARWLAGWDLFHAEAFSAWSYLLSGGYSKPAVYPERALALLQRIDRALSRWPRAFAGRCLIGLTKEKFKV